MLREASVCQSSKDLACALSLCQSPATKEPTCFVSLFLFPLHQDSQEASISLLPFNIHPLVLGRLSRFHRQLLAQVPTFQQHPFLTSKPASALAPGTMPTSPRDERSTSNSISAGIGAGTGIAVAGLILLLTASVVSFRRRKRHHPDPGPPTPVAETSSNVPFELLQQQQLDANTRAEYLPRCFTLSLSDDSVIKHRLGGEGAMIDFHARNRYHSNNISAKPETLHASLSQLQLSEDTRRMVVNLAIDSNTRPIAIRHLLALVIFSNLDTNSVGELSLLPPVVKELFKSLPTDPPESRDSCNHTHPHPQPSFC